MIHLCEGEFEWVSGSNVQPQVGKIFYSTSSTLSYFILFDCLTCTYTQGDWSNDGERKDN